MTQTDITPGSSLHMDIVAKPATLPLRLMTFNIRQATKSPFPGEELWSVRGPKLCDQLVFNTAGHSSPFLCFQEVLYGQLQDIQAFLGDKWSHIGRGRDKNPKDGEFSPVFYRADVWKCDREATKWLSKTPEKPSKGWDASMNRIVTMGSFRHRHTGTTVIVMSTHFDNRGVKARENSARLLITLANEWVRAAGDAEPAVVLIGGDFNSPPEDAAYKVMTARNSGFSDISDLIPRERHYGNYFTYTGFDEPDEPGQTRIDFIFIKEPHNAEIRTFGVDANEFDQGPKLSDHRAVISDLDIKV